MMVLCEGVPSWKLSLEEAGDFTLGEAEIADLFAGRSVTVRADTGADVTVHPVKHDAALGRPSTVTISATVAWPSPPAMPLLWEGDSA